MNPTGSWRYVKPIFDEKTAPCSATCPAGEDIPRIEMLAAAGEYQEALETILIENPFPAVCGHVCFHPCEHACNRSFFDAPVMIHHLERFIGNLAVQNKISDCVQKNTLNGKRIAIAGAGPSGLSAAYFLSRLGYACDVYEAEASAGGLLRWGIPVYRMPQSVLEKEIERIRRLGVQFYLRQKISGDFLEQAPDRYHALFIGCGQAHPIRISIPGENICTDGLAFLKDLRRGKPGSIKGVSAVIGGGNTAIDIARSLVRLGAAPVVIYRRRREDMPAFTDEVRMAMEEGVQLRELVAPIRIERDGKDILMTMQKMAIQSIDPITGRALVKAADQDYESLRTDHVFAAIGAEADARWSVTSAETHHILKLSHCTMTFKAMPTVYGGDLTNNFKSVTDAIASGKAAAMALDTYFREGRDAIEERLRACRIGKGPALSMASYLARGHSGKNSHTVAYDEINTDYFNFSQSTEPPAITIKKRMTSFDRILGDLTAGDAHHEAQRCFICGMCTACDNCVLFCPEAVVSADGDRRIDMDYCKGCGICVVECPRNAMTLKEEHHETGA
jgi:NADPH-dependent glutamate synthase beta subunit-like oxidoreductase/Pyruvate/2-oxoacid:ferredoxin oxidoreductase delta subunit